MSGSYVLLESGKVVAEFTCSTNSNRKALKRAARIAKNKMGIRTPTGLTVACVVGKVNVAEHIHGNAPCPKK
jgi:TATA-box binding protein (TBP) (component of TFIID and TFIIIB)